MMRKCSIYEHAKVPVIKQYSELLIEIIACYSAGNCRLKSTKMATKIDNSLTFSTLGKNFSRQYFKVFFLFFPENRL